MTDAYFTDETFDFLFDLDVHNERTWFKANQERYETHVREPMLRFITDFQEPLADVSRRFDADPRKVGGSMFRIHRDVRFSKDKRPYKTNVAAYFPHEQSGEHPAPGFYLHVEPGNSFAGGGLYRPDTATLTLVRQRIVDQPGAWTRVRNTLDDAGFRLGGDTLKRAPKGFDPHHPHIEDLKRKSFVASRQLADEQVTSPDFLTTYRDTCRGIAPLVRLLCRALDLPT